MEKQETKIAPLSIAARKANAELEAEKSAVHSFEAFAKSVALAHAEVKRAPTFANVKEQTKNVREAFKAIRELLAESNALRSIEKAQKRAKKFGVEL